MMVREVDSEMPGLVCLDMDRVLADHLSTWQFVYDRLESTTTSRSIFTTRGFLMNGIGLNSILHSSKIVGENNMGLKLLMPIYVHVWKACR